MIRSLIQRHLLAGLALTAGLAFVVPHVAQAQSAAAEQLFKKAQDELGAGNVKAACDDFKASDVAEPSVGARFNLGQCNEKQGKLASAWSAYKAAASLARAHGDNRAAASDSAAQALEGKLSMVKFTMKTHVQGLKITIDGEDQGGVLDTDLPVDPGNHTVQASAPGYVPQSVQLSVATQLERKTLPIPDLAVDTEGKYSGGGNGGGGGGSGLLIGGIVVGGLGVVGVVVGGAFGGLAINQKNNIGPNASPVGSMVCTKAACTDALSKAKTDATVATAGLIAGGILVAGGVTLAAVGLTKGKHAQEKAASLMIVPAVTPNAGGVVAMGTF